MFLCREACGVMGEPEINSKLLSWHTHFLRMGEFPVLEYLRS